MISKKTGEINFDKFILRPHMKLEILINRISREEILSWDKRRGDNIYLKPQKGSGVYFIIRLFFGSNDVGLTNLQIVVQKDNSIPSWENWSEGQQLHIKSINDEWLKKELGNPPYEYDWGNIRSVYNAREGSSYIAINYESVKVSL